jgi:chromosome partitioning protein
VSFAAVKGGVGKTRYAIFTANCLGAAGKRVLFVDTDINNSASFYYLLTREERELAKDKHIAGALSKSENDFADFAIPTSHPGISIVPSSLYLTDLRSIDTNRLSRMVEHISGDYDVVIIDCQPDYNNIVLNAVNASDLIVTPVLLDLDSYNAARFLRDKINYETNQKTDNWFLAINGYDKKHENAEKGVQQEYISLYTKTFPNMSPHETWYPWLGRLDMGNLKDKHYKLSMKKGANRVCHPVLFLAVYNLATCCTSANETLTMPEEF